MSITRDLMDTTRIQRTMRVLPYEEAKAATTRFIEGSLEKSDELTGWDLSFEEYIEEHRTRNYCSAGTHKVSQLFSAPLITTVSGRCSEKGSKVKGCYPNTPWRLWNG